MSKRLWLMVVCVSVCAMSWVVGGITPQGAVAQPLAAMPTGFISETVVSGLVRPTDIAWAADGRMFIAQQNGIVRVYQNDQLLSTPFIDLSAEVNYNSDRGLIGLAVHPDFPNTPYIYLLYTYDPPGVAADGGGARVSRLLRVGADPTNSNVAASSPASRTVLLGTNSTRANIGDETVDNNVNAPSCWNAVTSTYVRDCLPSDSPSHSIGTVLFASDGSLLVGNGDGAHYTFADQRAWRAQALDSLSGKILRINPNNGQGYGDNPFYNGDLNSNRSKVLSYGLRNPFRFTEDSTTGQIYIGDVGWVTWEELNRGVAKNFGWPCYEGSDTGSAPQGGYMALLAICANVLTSAIERPLYAYDHSLTSAAAQGGRQTTSAAFAAAVVYHGTAYPVQYQGALFGFDYARDWIHYFTFDGSGNATLNPFATQLTTSQSGIVQVKQGPDDQLYYVKAALSNGEVRRIRYVGINTPPTAIIQANPTHGTAPLKVSFSGLSSTDPEQQALTFFWNLGDGTISWEPTVTHTYAAGGVYYVRMWAIDTGGLMNMADLYITVDNSPPVATISTPISGTRYNVGQTINFSGIGTDAEDGALSGAAMQWDVVLHHGDHVHPGFFTASGVSGSFVVPDHGDDTWLELCLTATDSSGLHDQKCRALQPNTVVYTLMTQPPGLGLFWSGAVYTTPFTRTPIVGSQQQLIAAPIQAQRSFSHWSDGGTQAHFVTIGTAPQTLTASYVNHAPTIVNPGPQTTNEDVAKGPIALLVGDDEVGANALIFGVSSSNTALVPSGNLLLGGSGPTRTLSLTPIPNQSGVTTITVSASDGLSTTQMAFRLTVNPINDAPTLSSMMAQSATAGVPLTVTFTISDIDNVVSSLNLSATASNNALVSDNAIQFSGVGVTRTLVLTPTANRSGVTMMTLAVSDGLSTTQTTFSLTITDTNDAPTLSAIPDQSSTSGTPLIVMFEVNDVDNVVSSLSVSASSSNTTLVPNEALTLSGSGATRALVITPTVNQVGVTTITLIASDGLSATQTSFVLTVSGWKLFVPLIFR